MKDAGVRTILLQDDSPGGEITGCLKLSDYIYSLRGAKPVYAVADDFAFSAAYALTSAADKVFVTRMGAVGSVGVVVLHTEDSKFNDEQGFKYTYIFKGDRKVDGNPHEPLSERAEKDIQSEIDRQYDQFVATVARNRKADAEKIIATQPGVYWSENAVPLLADAVGTLGDAMNSLRQLLGEPVQSSTAAIAAMSTTKEVTASMPNETLILAAEGKSRATVAPAPTRANDRVVVADRTSPRQKGQRDHPGSILSLASGSAIKRITAGVKARR